MELKQNIFLQWQDEQAVSSFSSAVSLHSHTMHSLETLESAPQYIYKYPVLSSIARFTANRYKKIVGKDIDFSRICWVPPLSARDAYEVEKKQITDTYGMISLVSLTDHNTIEAPVLLQLAELEPKIPISMEWTIPYGLTEFHIGVHNIPAEKSQIIYSELMECSKSKKQHAIVNMLAELNKMPTVLLVFNHPLWNESGAGSTIHRILAESFAANYYPMIHALELSGIRSWKENTMIAELAKAVGLPVVAGGDRHGCTPNPVINVSHAKSFDEYAEEVRKEKSASILVLNKYRESLKYRAFEVVLDVLGDYPDHPYGLRKCYDRLYYVGDDGVRRPFSYYWQGDGPDIASIIMRTLRFFQNRSMRNALKVTFG